MYVRQAPLSCPIYLPSPPDPRVSGTWNGKIRNKPCGVPLVVAGSVVGRGNQILEVCSRQSWTASNDMSLHNDESKPTVGVLEHQAKCMGILSEPGFRPPKTFSIFQGPKTPHPIGQSLTRYLGPTHPTALTVFPSLDNVRRIALNSDSLTAPCSYPK